MKLSVSLPDDDVEFLDRYADRHGAGSRSAALHRAVRLLRASELGAAYEAAWSEWAGEAEGDPGAGIDSLTWEATIGDGLG